MLRTFKLLLAIPFCSLLIPVVIAVARASAGLSNEPVVPLHVTAAVSKGDLCDLLDPVPCSDFVVNRPSPSGYYTFLVATKVDSTVGISGLSCGISMPVFIAASWHLCADNEFRFGPWPLDGGGNRIEWSADNCQRREYEQFEEDGVRAVPGYFYVYAYGNSSLGITPNYAAGDSQLVVADCNDDDMIVEIGGGVIGFGTTPGFNPCLVVVDSERSTWGHLKTKFGGPKQ
jgi:hypothetical protein